MLIELRDGEDDVGRHDRQPNAVSRRA